MTKKVFLLSLLLILFSTAFLKEAAAYPKFLGNKVVCPVSGEAFNIGSDSKKVSYEGKIYYFCSPDCATLFNADQKKYLQGVEEKKSLEEKKIPGCKGE
ncbi:MAG: YHS domain-containing protein [Candidatus Omnitrophota bacterium]|nr:YHS domain-containing protein [Candidatus Omnitrophota bacterium]